MYYIEKYLGNGLLIGNGFLLICLLVCKGIDVQGCRLSIFYSKILGIILCSSLVIYIIIIALFYLRNEKLQFVRIAEIIFLMFINIVFLLMYKVLSVKDIVISLGIVIVCCIVYTGIVSGVCTESLKKNNENIKIKKYRDDRIYIEELIEKVSTSNLKNRIGNEVFTYIYNAKKYKGRYYIFSFLSIFFPSAIVMINSSGIIEGATLNIVVSLLSMATVIVTGVANTMKLKKSWIRNRKYAELAKSEIFKWIEMIGEYKNGKTLQENEELLAENLEKLYQEENGYWRELREEPE